MSEMMRQRMRGIYQHDVRVTYDGYDGLNHATRNNHDYLDDLYARAPYAPYAGVEHSSGMQSGVVEVRGHRRASCGY